MDFEKLYSKLPGFIKYNNSVLNFFIGCAKKVRNLPFVKSQQQSASEFKRDTTLRYIQLFNLELLRFIDNVCKKYNISYWLNGGTLLGAARHGGFIPWDDDIDLSFLRKDYEKFIEVIPKEIDKCGLNKEIGLSLLRDNFENYFTDSISVYDFEGDEELFSHKKSMFLQIAWMKPYIKIDCFPQDYILEEKLDYFNKMYVCTKYKFNNEIGEGKKRFDDEFNIKCMELGLTKNETGYINDSIDTIDIYPVSIREIDEVLPLNSINFEGYLFKCPKNIDYYLKTLFGSTYMEFPDVIETHNSVQFVKSQFGSEDEMNERFKKDIAYLKEINDNY